MIHKRANSYQNTISHYDKNAQAYSNQRQNGILGYIVKQETKAVMQALSLEKDMDVLDAGCGDGRYSNLILHSGACPFGVDISPRMIEAYNCKGFKGIAGDLETISLDIQYDRILCAGSIEFVSDPEKVFSNLKRFLKPDGFIVWLYPRPGLMGYIYRLYHFKNKLWINLFSVRKLTQICKASQLKISENYRVTNLSSIAKLMH